MMRVTILLIFLINICGFTFAQNNTKPTTFSIEESFEFVLQDVITFINDNKFENLDGNLKIKFDSI